MSKERITHLYGVDVSEYKPVQLSRENLQGLGFEECPQRLRHLLVHAAQFQLPVPSRASMERTEKRNKAKAAKEAKTDVVVRPRRTAKRKIKGSLKRRAPAPLAPPPPSKPRSVKSLNTFKVRSPEENVLKAARQECCTNLEEWFGKGEEKQSVSNGVVEEKMKREFPLYFQKKHRSHKRRMRERWQLIKANRDKLVQLFGGKILSRDCRIGIKQVKRVLGLVDNTAMDVEQPVGEFLAMINEHDQRSSSNSDSSSSSSQNSQTPMRSRSPSPPK